MKLIFLSIYNFFAGRKLLLYLIFLASFAAAAFFAFQVKFEEDISKIIPRDNKIDKLTQVFQDSKFTDKLVMMVSLKDTTATPQPDSLIAYADQLVAKIDSNLSGYINKLQYQVDEEMNLAVMGIVSDYLPIYIDRGDYAAIDSLLKPQKIRQTLQSNINTLTSPAGLALKNIIARDPLGITFLGLRKMQDLQYDENFELYDGRIITRDQKHVLFFISPKFPPNNTLENGKFLDGINSIADSLQTSGFANVESSYFGAVAVSVGNAQQLRRDSILTQGIVVLFIVVLLGVYFRKKRAPFIILLPVLYGAVFSLAAIYFIKGNISVIALGTGSVVLGIAVNYSLHVFNHYMHTRNMADVLKDLSLPLTVGSFTTIGGFLCLQFVKSDMLKDLGLFAAFSLIGASLCSLIFLPHFIFSKKLEASTTIHKLSWFDRIASYRLEGNRTLVVSVILLTILFWYTSSQVEFESDLNRMNYMSAKLQASEKKLNNINAYALQSVYLVSEGKTLNEALKNNEKLVTEIEKLKEVGVVKKYSGVTALMLSDSLQRIRIDRWKRYWTPVKKQLLFDHLEREGAALKYKPSAFNNLRAMLNRNFSPLPQNEVRQIQKTYFDDYITEKNDQSTVVTLVKVSPGQKQVIYDEFEKEQNTVVLDRQYLTGKFVDIIQSDFSSIAWMSSILVFTVLLLTYGRIELALVSFIPMLITWIWILGIMGMLGIKFNIINIIVSALIFGLGDDYSLFIMDGLLQDYRTGKKNMSSYKSSILLSAVITVAGLGVLIFAQHPALKSIAVISIIGIMSVVLMSNTLIPVLFNFLITNRVKKGFVPWTLSGLFISLFAFTYFVFGSLLVTVLGFLVVKLNPFFKKTSKRIYHTMISSWTWSLMYIMGNFRKSVVNPQKEKFRPPAVVIANHQSFLDILIMTMLYPRVILFTNKWVYNSPVFGAVVRMADYYHVAMGAEESVEKLEKHVKNGYSIVIFPEGTRSPDASIRRFHKGAFYLAEKLKLDILPVVIHGTANTMSKGDFLLKNSPVTITYLPRIKPTDQRFGENYTERAKLVGRYFRNTYQDISDRIETPSYYRELLCYNYIYKGPVLEWYMRVKTSLEKNYELFNNLLPKQGSILDIGCGYGFMTYMLNFVHPERKLTGIDYDEEKIEVAAHSFSRNENINFETADITKWNFGTYDGIVMADMLHYLEPAQQINVIRKSIDSLNAGGVIVIRDANKDLKKRHRGTRLSEFFSTKLIGFNKTGEKGLFFLSAATIKEAAAGYDLSVEEIDNTKFTSNIIFVLRKHPAPVDEKI